MLVDVPTMLWKLGIRDIRQSKGESWACCPLPGHDEKKSSWSIISDRNHPKNGYHKCFGCGRKGGPIHLVSAVIGITNSSAFDWLKDNGCLIDNQTPDTLPSQVRVEIGDRTESPLELPKGVVVGKPFCEWPLMARRYLAERGVTAYQVATYGFGFGTFGEQRDRIVIPTRNQYGALLFYTGRSYRNSQLRYRSSDRKSGSRPKAALFGEVMWRYRSPFDVYAAEGAFKVLAIEKALCPVGNGSQGPAIAAFSGAEIHDEQILKLRRFERIIYFADCNETGIQFAQEVDRKMAGKIVRVIVPRPGEEADTITTDELRALLG